MKFNYILHNGIYGMLKPTIDIITN